MGWRDNPKTERGRKEKERADREDVKRREEERVSWWLSR